MAQITNSKEIKLAGLSARVFVRELTVGEVREWVSALEEDERDLVDRGLFEDVSIPDLVRMTSLKREEIDTLRPSEVRDVINACKEMNPDFFGFLGRLSAASQAMPLAG